mgnify:CR=1 FL=1
MRSQVTLFIRHVQGDGAVLVVDAVQQVAVLHVVFRMRLNELSLCLELDDGDGFGDSDLDEIFDFGFSNTGGTGIGLYNVQSVVKKMKGTICAEKASASVGAKFIIDIP